MKCPNVEKGGCPSKRDMNEHTNDCWSEYYCESCGYEGKDVFDAPRPVKREPLPPLPPRRKKSTSTQQY